MMPGNNRSTTSTCPEELAAFSFSHLPLEILYVILRHLDIPDILQLRRVSRYLNRVSRFRQVWSDAYRKAGFVRPPGPFLAHSAHELERALVSSFRVDRNLRVTMPRAIKFREIRYTGLGLRVSLVFGGRFLLVALSEEVRCYDLSLDAFDSNSGASIIYRPTDGVLTSFHCASAIDVEGRPFACAVFTETTDQQTMQISICLLNVSVVSEVTLDLLHQFEHPTFHIVAVDLGPRVVVVQGEINGLADLLPVAFDVHARSQLLLPSIVHMWETTDESREIGFVEDMNPWPTSISTSTHLLLGRSFYTRAAGWHTFVQAYTLPLPSSDTHRCALPTFTSMPKSPNPSHRGILPGVNFHDVVLLRDATIDPSTQDTLLTIRVDAFEMSRPRTPLSKYGVLRLSHNRHRHHQSQRNDDDEELGTVTFEPLGLLGSLSPRTPIQHPSFNGTGLAFCMREPSFIVQALEYDVRDDAEARVTDHPDVLRFTTPRALADYDPYCGRLCFHCGMAKYSVIEIMDLAI